MEITVCRGRSSSPTTIPNKRQARNRVAINLSTRIRNFRPQRGPLSLGDPLRPHFHSDSDFVPFLLWYIREMSGKKDAVKPRLRRRSYSTPQLQIATTAAAATNRQPPLPRRGPPAREGVTAPLTDSSSAVSTPRADSAPSTPRGRVFVPVARARAKQSRDLLVLRKKPSAVTRHVTPLSQRAYGC